MTRQEANREILKILTKAVELAPDQRFSQLLQNLDVVIPVVDEETFVITGLRSEYTLESEELLKRIQQSDLACWVGVFS